MTFRPINIDVMTVAERCRLFNRLRKKLDQYARQYGFPLTIAWARESAEDGTGEHLHCLIHVPQRHRKHFSDTAWGWLPDRATGAEGALEYMTSVDVRPAHQRTKFTEAGKIHNAIGYLVKQMASRAGGRPVGFGAETRWVRYMNQVKGGPIFGKRAGISRSLGTKAVDAWRPEGAQISTRPPATLPT